MDLMTSNIEENEKKKLEELTKEPIKIEDVMRSGTESEDKDELTKKLLKLKDQYPPQKPTEII